MQNRKTKTKRLNEKPSALVRDKEYFFNTLDLEHDLLKKATDLAERMMVAFMRENRMEVSVDVDDIADKIIDKIIDKLPEQRLIVREGGSGSQPVVDDFSFDDGPVVIKTDKVKIKGNVGKESKSKDNIDESLEKLEDFKL